MSGPRRAPPRESPSERRGREIIHALNGGLILVGVLLLVAGALGSLPLLKHWPFQAIALGSGSLVVAAILSWALKR